MSLFGSILNKIFHHGGGGDGATTSQHPAPSSTDAQPQANPAAAPAGSPAAASAQAQAPVAPAAQAVNVEQVLEGMAAQKGGGGNWRTSIVDLLKLLDLDSSLSARKDLANELSVHVAADGSAEENEALIKAV